LLFIPCPPCKLDLTMPPRPNTDTNRMRRDKIIMMALFGLALAVFSPILANDFVQWDDDISVYQNPHIQGLDGERLRWMFSSGAHAIRYKPLIYLVYALIYQVSGPHAFGYHLVSLIIHSLNVVLVFILLPRFLSGNSAQPKDET